MPIATEPFQAICCASALGHNAPSRSLAAPPLYFRSTSLSGLGAPRKAALGAAWINQPELRNG